MKIKYEEQDIEEIIGYFAEGFDARVKKYEWFYDATKGKVIFRMFFDEKHRRQSDV